jgi:hypothetical protein
MDRAARVVDSMVVRSRHMWEGATMADLNILVFEPKPPAKPEEPPEPIPVLPKPPKTEEGEAVRTEPYSNTELAQQGE